MLLCYVMLLVLHLKRRPLRNELTLTKWYKLIQAQAERRNKFYSYHWTRLESIRTLSESKNYIHGGTINDLQWANVCLFSKFFKT